MYLRVCKHLKQIRRAVTLKIILDSNESTDISLLRELQLALLFELTVTEN